MSESVEQARRRRPVELRLTFKQSVELQSVLDGYVSAARPSKTRASIALMCDCLRSAHRKAAAVVTGESVEQAAPALRSWHVPGIILSFVDAMREADCFDLDTLAYFYEKPWKWENEYVLWLNHGEPMDESCAGWQDWLRLMDAP